jgi:hypothetical protein
MGNRPRALALAAPALCVVGLGLAGRAAAHSWLGECRVYFDNEFALEHVYAQARSTFGLRTGLSSTGDTEVCDPAVHQACWLYRHRCFSNYINVDDMTYGHVHLSFEDPSLTCPFADPGDGGGAGFGRMIDGECVPANWGSEPRYLQSHLPDHWIKVWMEDRVTHQPRVFDLSEIHVSGDKAIQFWFKRTDGTWWCWRELGPRKRWKLANWAHDLIEVRIRGAAGAGSAGPYTVRGFTIQD